MRKKLTRMKSIWAVLVGLGFMAACTNPTDIEEIKNNQKRILQKLASLEKKVRSSGAAPQKQKPKRPPVDYNKVHKIRTEGVAYKGAKNPKVTIVEYTDYQ